MKNKYNDCDKHKCCDGKIRQDGDALAEQRGRFCQLNKSSQSDTIALSIAGVAIAAQVTDHNIITSQTANSVTINDISTNTGNNIIGENPCPCCCDIDQRASSSSRDDFDTNNTNISQQGTTFAATVGGIAISPSVTLLDITDDRLTSATAINADSCSNETTLGASSPIVTKIEAIRSDTATTKNGEAGNKNSTLEANATHENGKMVLSVKRGGEERKVELDKDGNIVLDENTPVSINNQAIPPEFASGAIHMTFGKGEEKFEVNADAQGNITVNGDKI